MCRRQPHLHKFFAAGVQLGAMYLTADGAEQDEAIGYLPKLPYPIGPNQYTPATMLTLSPPNYDTQVNIAYPSAFSAFVSETKSCDRLLSRCSPTLLEGFLVTASRVDLLGQHWLQLLQ